MSTPLHEVPELLKSIPNWVQWKLTPNEDGDLGKVPFVAGTNFGKKAASTRSATWTTFEEATRNIVINDTQGVGFVIHGEATNIGLVGFDLDGCRDPKSEEIAPWAAEIIDALDSYTEVTPSRTGVRIWVKGKLPGTDHVFNLNPSVGYGDKVKIEIYNSGRYFTVTGDAYFESAAIEERDLTEAYRLCQAIGKKYAPKKSETIVAPTTAEAGDVLPTEGARVKKTGTVITSKLELLMHGEIISRKPFVISDGRGNSIDEYPTHSEADLGLCTALALKHGNQPELIFSEYENSSLYREKWGERKDYFLSHTVAKAIKTAERITAEHNKAKDVSATTNTLNAITQVTPAEGELLVSVDGDQFMAENIPPRRVLLRTISNKEPVFFQQSINQIFAWRGIGKTNVGLGITMALATAGSFLNWEVSEKCRVLYIDGEMPQSQMQQRWKAIVGKTDGYARLITLDKQPRNLMSKLSTQIGRDKVEAHLEKEEAEGRRVDVVLLDSISTLFNVKANDEEVWLDIQDWLINLRSRGLTIIFFHHAGKLGASRSHSKSEDMLDVSIKLEAPKERESGCLHAVLSYDKARAGLDEPAAEIKMKRVHSAACACRKSAGLVIGCPGDSVAWEYKPSADANKMKAGVMFEDGATLGDIAKALGVPRATVQSWKKKWDDRVVVDLESRP